MTRLRFSTASEVFDAFPTLREDLQAPSTSESPPVFLHRLAAGGICRRAWQAGFGASFEGGRRSTRCGESRQHGGLLVERAPSFTGRLEAPPRRTKACAPARILFVETSA